MSTSIDVENPYDSTANSSGTTASSSFSGGDFVNYFQSSLAPVIKVLLYNTSANSSGIPWAPRVFGSRVSDVIMSPGRLLV